MKGDLKTSSNKRRLSHLQFAKVHKWCVDNIQTLRDSEYPAVARTATLVFGFPVSACSIGEIGRDLGISKHGSNGGGKTPFLPNNRRAQAIYECIDELYDQLEIKSERRDALRDIFGVRPAT